MKKEKDWFKDRGYPHFTEKTPLQQKSKILTYIKKSKNISQHSFSPLILKNITQRRYKLTETKNGLKRSHKKIKNGIVISNKKIRPILYATHIDSHIYSYYSRVNLGEKYEAFIKKDKQLSEAITAYRQIKVHGYDDKFKNNVHFAKDVFDEIKRRGDCVAMAFDIENFFPSLDHNKLKKVWCEILGTKSLPKDHFNIFKSVTRFSYVRLVDFKTKNHHFDEKKLSELRKKGKTTLVDSIKELSEEYTIYKNQYKIDNKIAGIPQGLPISALLANMYMLPFDRSIIGTFCLNKDVFYRRYSDDIIVVCPVEKAREVEGFVLTEIRRINLKISAEKKEETKFKKNNGKVTCYRIDIDGKEKENVPLNYLGFEFYGDKTLIKSKNISSFYRKMKQSIKTKHKRAEKHNEYYLLDKSAIYKRKIYRNFSFKGVKKREIPSQRLVYKNKKSVSIKGYRKFRGNYIKYIYNSSEEMNAPEIKRQIRNHWKILQKTINQYGFLNDK